MLILIICAASLDYGYNKLQAASYPQFQFAPAFWYEGLASIILAVALLGTAWFVLYISPRSYFIASTYLLVGLLALLSVTFFGYSQFLSPLTRPIPILYAWVTEIVSSPLSLTAHVAAMIFVIGAARLLPERVLRPKTSQ